MEHNVGVLGVGFVGSAVSTGLQIVSSIREYDKFKPTESLYDVVNNSDILFFCLPTPMGEDGECNVDIIRDVAKEVNEIAERSKLCVIKSTVPPGTTQDLANEFINHGWVFNPEFLTEKNFMEDFLNQDRIIIGLTKQISHKNVELIEDLYEKFTKTQEKRGKIFLCHSQEAEMLKYMSNCFLATKVAFFNEMKEICDIDDIDYDRVVDLLKKDERIGNSHMTVPGPDGKFGFGGACFPKDINALIAYARRNDLEPMLLDSVWSKNLLIREDYDWEDLAQVTGEYDEV